MDGGGGRGGWGFGCVDGVRECDGRVGWLGFGLLLMYTYGLCPFGVGKEAARHVSAFGKWLWNGCLCPQLATPGCVRLAYIQRYLP